jgi:type I restriction enzyme S subunit
MQITKPQCFVTNNSFIFDPSHPDNFFWLFLALRHRGLKDVVGGAAQPQITLEGISSIRLVIPPVFLRSQFQKLVTSIFELAWSLDGKNANLRTTRDLLLPKLISGELNVSELDIAIGEQEA